MALRSLARTLWHGGISAAPLGGALAASRRTADALPSGACSCSYSGSAAAADPASCEQERTKLVNKLLYRAKQRGFLELDLLVGLWAEQQLPAMSLAGLRDFAHVLDEENPDLFKWLTGQLPTPDHLARNEQYRALKAHVDRQLADNLHHAAAAVAGKDWVRGWDDPNKAPTRAGEGAAEAKR